MMFSEQLKVRIARIKEFMNLVVRCWHIERDLVTAEKDIMRLVASGNVDTMHACIKVYCNCEQNVLDQNTRDDVFSRVRYCPHFESKQCKKFDCMCHKRNKKYTDTLSLLCRTKSDKRLAFKRIFERIK